MSRRLSPVILMLSVLFILTIQTASAQGLPLPSLPDMAIRMDVLAETSGARFIPLNTPQSIRSELGGFRGVFADVADLLSYRDAVHYIKLNGTLAESLIPLKASGSAALAPTMEARGENPRPGQIIGAIYQPANGVMVVVAVFPAESAGCTSNCVPESVRFYTSGSEYTEESLIFNQFVDINNDLQLEAVDAGAILADDYSCLSVGLNQLCWEPYNYLSVRQDAGPQALVTSAYDHFKQVYEFNATFSVENTVPDLLGRSYRNRCANLIASANSFRRMSDCAPNVVFTASRENVADEPIGIMVVLEAADIRAYRSNGRYTGVVAPGEYLVMDAMPHITQPGEATLLFLVNVETQGHYLIPSIVQQAFGQNSSLDERNAGIRDGVMSWRGVGY